MHQVRIFGSVLPALFLALPLTAQQKVKIDFHEYASDTTTSYQAAIGRPVTSHGLDFYQASGFQTPPANANNALGTWGTKDAGALNRPVNLGSSTALWGTTLGGEIDLFNSQSDVFTGRYAPFSLFSMDVSHLYSSAYSPIAIRPFNLTFYAFTADTAYTQTFSFLAPPIFGGVQTPVLQTLIFNDQFQNVLQVAWNQGSGSGSAHQFTNVVASTPEPSSMVLLGTGFTGLFGITARRRRKNSINI